MPPPVDPLPWYVAGPLIGLLVPILLLVGGRSFGVSANLRHACSALPAPARFRPSFLRYDWRTTGAWNLVFALGIAFGGFVGLRVLGDPTAPLALAPATASWLAGLGVTDLSGMVPASLISWAGLSTPAGALLVLGGGFLVGFGARWAGGLHERPCHHRPRELATPVARGGRWLLRGRSLRGPPPPAAAALMMTPPAPLRRQTDTRSAGGARPAECVDVPQVDGPSPTGLSPLGLLAYGLLGAGFGLVLIESQVISWFRIVEMFRFESFHMYGVIGSAVATAALGLWAIRRLGLTTLSGEPIRLAPKAWGGSRVPGARYWMGGTVFGLGWALLGACPGPLLALLRDARGPRGRPRRYVGLRPRARPPPALDLPAMLFRQITDSHLAQYAYLIGCQRTKEALVIDPERDIDRYLAIAEAEGLTLTHVAETHIHADFLSGARDLADATGARLYLSAEGEDAGWGSFWARDRDDVTFLRDGDTFRVGNIEITAMHSPGHTPEHLSYLVTDHGGGASTPMGLASGDFVFVGDLGRPDLLESAAGQAGAQDPAARALYDSVQRFLELDDQLQVWPGHGAGSACGKALGAVPQSTVGYERTYNGSIDAARRGEAAFVEAILDSQPEPPLYFARMKALNRDGVPPLAALPSPREVDASELVRLGTGAEGGATVIDTRPDRLAFMAAHLPGSLFAPFDKSFNTVVGSFVTDSETALVLVIDETNVEAAVRDLVRIGLDRVEAFATPETLEAALRQSSATIPAVDFEAVRDRAEAGAVLDVRRAAEFSAGHVPGATNLAHTRLAAHLDELPEGSPLYVHCQSGVRAAVASAFLAREGFDVRYVDDGFPHYREIADAATEVTA